MASTVISLDAFSYTFEFALDSSCLGFFLYGRRAPILFLIFHFTCSSSSQQSWILLSVVSAILCCCLAERGGCMIMEWTAVSPRSLWNFRFADRGGCMIMEWTAIFHWILRCFHGDFIGCFVSWTNSLLLRADILCLSLLHYANVVLYGISECSHLSTGLSLLSAFWPDVSLDPVSGWCFPRFSGLAPWLVLHSASAVFRQLTSNSLSAFSCLIRVPKFGLGTMASPSFFGFPVCKNKFLHADRKSVV